MGTGEAAFARIARASHNRVQHLHQSRPIILYDIYLRPNGSNSSIDARPTIDIEPRRRLSLKMKPFEYRGIERYITFNHWLVVAVPRDLLTSEQEPGSLWRNVDSDRAFRTSVVAKVASDRRIGYIKPSESGDLRLVRAAEVGESSRQLDISLRAPDEIGMVGPQGRP